jgi:hypothetical protein
MESQWQPPAAGKEEAAAVTRVNREEGEEREIRERRKKGCTPVQVGASHANRTDAIESRCLLWHDWWTCDILQQGRQSRHSRRCNCVTSDNPT